MGEGGDVLGLVQLMSFFAFTNQCAKNILCPDVGCLKPAGNLWAVFVCMNRSFISLMDRSVQHHRDDSDSLQRIQTKK